MANPIKGEVSFQASGEEFTLVFDFNALCTIEDEFDVEASRLDEVIGGRASAIRKIFRIGLSRHHPGMSDEKAGELIQAVGPTKAADMVTQAFARAFPEAAKGNARPPKAAKAGTS